MEFEWSVSKKDRHMPWRTFIIIGVLSVIAAIYFFFKESYFATALFIIAPAVMVLTSLQGPEQTLGSITDKGVKINNTNYKYDFLEFFSIISDNLLLKPKDGDIMYIPINEEEDDEIRGVLSNYIPEKEYEEKFVDIVNRFLRIH